MKGNAMKLGPRDDCRHCNARIFTPTDVTDAESVTAAQEGHTT